MIKVDAVLSSTVTVKVSTPSVVLSATIGMEIVAKPLLPTTTVPLTSPPVISSDDTPLIE